jgi:hypothetical protein
MEMKIHHKTGYFKRRNLIKASDCLENYTKAFGTNQGRIDNGKLRTGRMEVFNNGNKKKSGQWRNRRRINRDNGIEFLYLMEKFMPDRLYGRN